MRQNCLFLLERLLALALAEKIRRTSGDLIRRFALKT